MNRQRTYSKSGIQSAQSVYIVHHTQQYRRRQGCMGRQALQIVHDADRWGSARMEACKTTVFQGDLVVETDQFHEHVAYEED